MSDTEDTVLRGVYYDTSNPAGYSTASRLAQATNIPLERVQAWLDGEEPYTLHRPARKNYPRNAYKVYFIDDLWQADLVDLSSKAKENGGYTFLLTVIDVFSKFAFVRPLLSKSAKDVAAAFQSIFTESGRKPGALMTDKGKEFLNATLQKLLKQEGVHFYTSEDPEKKAAVVERFNRTLKGRMWKFFTHTSTYTYVDELPKLVAGYNSTVHSTIKLAPKDVNEKNMKYVYARLKRKWATAPPKKFPTLTVGSHVRISVDKGPFGKGFEENWSQETFIIKRILPRTPVVFVLEDQKGERVTGTFYREEIQKVKPPEVFKIEKVLRTLKRGGKVRYFVKFRGYPDKFNAWVDDLVNLV